MWIYGGKANHATGKKTNPKPGIDLCKLWESKRKDVSIWRERGAYYVQRPGEWMRLPVTTVTEAIRRVHRLQHGAKAGVEEM